MHTVYTLFLSMNWRQVSLTVLLCPSPRLALMPLWHQSVFCSQGYDLEMKWPQPFCQEPLCTSATPWRAMETGLEATLFCFTSLILACALFCSSWEELQLFRKSPCPSALSWKLLSLSSPHDPRTARTLTTISGFLIEDASNETFIVTHLFMAEKVVRLKGIWFHK